MKRLLLPAALLCLILTGNAVLPAGSLRAQSESKGTTKISLKDALKQIGDAHGTRFAYERSVIAGIQVSYNWSAVKSNTPEQILSAILPQTGLSFVTIGKNYFTIVKKPALDITAAFKNFEDSVAKTVVPGSPNSKGALFVVATVPYLSGHITNAVTGKPVEAVTVSLVQLGLVSVTNVAGMYQFLRLPAGTYTLRVQGVNIVPVEKDFTIGGGDQSTVAGMNAANRRIIDIPVTENVLSLKEVQVVGVESKSLSRSTLIGRAAIEHMQATNLGEVLQLLPGMVTENPSFSNVNKAMIRQFARQDKTGDDVNSLGTSVIINGAPLSNNANLQALGTATSGTLASFSTASGMGTDMRQLSADNVESVEVIRGIPSVEYGDLSSGAIIVKTKASKEPAQLKARLNPRLTQFWLGKGFGLGKNKGALFADIDFTKAYDKQTQANDAFERVTSSVQYTRSFGRTRPLHTNTTASFAMNLDESKVDPDYAIDQIVRRAQDYAFRFTTNGRWIVGKRLIRSLNYTLSASYSHQKGFQQEYFTRDVSPVSTAKENITMEVDYLASRYLNQVWIDGKPLNLFARVSDNFYARTGILTHSFLAGADWKMDANYGKGRTFDEKLPPRTVDNGGFRTRAFSDIPALHQMGFYAEDKISAKLNNRTLAVQLGIRYDKLQPFGADSKSVLAPRINASFEVLNNFFLRAGYGVAAKMPTLLYMYPDRAYFDMVSLNHYKDNPAERMALMTTRVFNTSNPALQIAKATKNELGFDWAFAPKKRLSVTVYYEDTKNGYEMSDNNLNNIQFTTIPKYKVESEQPGQKPILSPEVKDSLWVVRYSAPTNSRHLTNKGIEFDLDFGRIDKLRTSFVLNGAYMSVRSVSTDPYVLLQQVVGQPLTRLAVFGTDRGRLSERFSTTLRAIHNIPELGFVVTLAAQTIWMDKDKYLNYMRVPTGYIPLAAAGEQAQIIDFTKEQREAITPADRDLYLSLNDAYFRTESWKPLWLFNIKLTKEFARNMVFSFFANNVIQHQPLQASKRIPTDYEKRNIDLFFGTELSIKF